jgi:hypothetical protein
MTRGVGNNAASEGYFSRITTAVTDAAGFDFDVMIDQIGGFG